MIEVNELTKKYMVKKALHNCTMTFERGKIIGVIGENGSGKTTLLKLLAGILRPSTGTVMVDSEKVNRRVSSKLAYLTDVSYFYPYFTINELINYYETQYCDFDKSKALEITNFMNLQLEQKVRYLSKGNLNRLKIAVTLARKAPYIVLDEPFSGLDPLVRKAIIQGMIKFVDLQTQSIIMTTHEVKEVEPLLDEVVLLRKGKVIAQKSVEEIREIYGLDVTNWMEHMYEKGNK